MKTLARFSFRHRWLVLAVWVVALLGSQALAAVTGHTYVEEYLPPEAESTEVQHLLEDASRGSAGDVDQIVFAVDRDAVTQAAYRGTIESTIRAVSGLPHVVGVVSPLSPEGAGQISEDGQVAYATVQFDETAASLAPAVVTRVIDTARSYARPGLQIELGGPAISNQAAPNLGGVLFGIIVAALVLFLAFGSLLATGLPLATAILSVGTSLAVIEILSNAISTADFTTQLATLIGLGVGIDYAMFIVSRHRTSLLRGDDPERAVVTAVNTSGRAVLFAGITVCIALLGMFAIGIKVFYGVAVGASVAVVITMLAALTLQPALLGFFGARVLSRRQRRALAAGARVATSPLWSGWATQLRRRPATYAVAGLVVIAVLAAPLASLRLGFSDAGNEPTSTTSRRAYDLLSDGFAPGFNGPFLVIADRTDADAQASFSAVLGELARNPGVADVSPGAVVGSGEHAVQVARLIPTTSPQAEETTRLLRVLRDEVIPAATAGHDLQVRVGGIVAVNEDFSKTISDRLALFIGLVIGLSCLLLAAVFRSLVVPLLAAVMNLLAVAAAFGVVTAVFEEGWLAESIGLHTTGPIEPFIPVIVFAILFGLSMDYEVFLVARMHEIWLRTKDNATAVTGGLAHTGRVITAAAAIMIAVFSAFALGDNRIIKLFGLGLTSAVVIDALIIRTLVLPAVMLLVGPRNWAMPAALERVLPRLDVEGARPDDVQSTRELVLSSE